MTDLDQYIFGVVPGDHGQGEWWLPAPPPVETAEEIDLPNDWWAGCLEGFRLGLELGRAQARTVESEAPQVDGLRMRATPRRRR